MGANSGFRNNQFSDARLRSGHLYLFNESDREQTVIFEASGHTQALINGYPFEGDHYDFGYSLIPLQLKKGGNYFVLNSGRHPRIRARLIKPSKTIQLTTRDMTLPDLLEESEESLWGAI